MNQPLLSLLWASRHQLPRSSPLAGGLGARMATLLHLTGATRTRSGRDVDRRERITYRKDDLQITVTAVLLPSLCGLLCTRHSEDASRRPLQRTPYSTLGK